MNPTPDHTGVFPYSSPDPMLNPFLRHLGHRIDLGVYGPSQRPLNVAAECLDRFEVLFDADIAYDDADHNDIGTVNGERG